MFDKLMQYRKAIVAALIAGLTALYAAMSDDVITAGEWVMIALAVLGGGGATWAIPNAPKQPTVNIRDDAPTVRR